MYRSIRKMLVSRGTGPNSKNVDLPSQKARDGKERKRKKRGHTCRTLCMSPPLPHPAYCIPQRNHMSRPCKIALIALGIREQPGGVRSIVGGDTGGNGMTSRSRVDSEMVRCSLGVLGYAGRRERGRKLKGFQSRRRK